MTFCEALGKAEKSDPGLHYAWMNVLKARGGSHRTPCYLFAVNGTVYYFGYDGVELKTGHHSPKVSARMINAGVARVVYTRYAK